MSEQNADNQLQSCLLEIEGDAKVLQEALLSRNTAGILTAVARHEAALLKLQKLQESLSPSTLADKAKASVRRTRDILRTNRTLAQSFLDIMDTALFSLAAGEKTASVYNQSGKAGMMTSPLLVQEKG